MKIAIISVSFKGKKLAHQLKEKLDKDSTIISTVLYHKNVRKYFQLIFYEYDAIMRRPPPGRGAPGPGDRDRKSVV